MTHIDNQSDFKLVTSTEKIHDVYNLHKEIIGSGSFGHIRIAQSKHSNNTFAIKTIKKEKLKG